MTIVEFPGLGLSFRLSRVAFTVFGFPIYWYGVFIGFGVFLAILFALRQAPRFGLDSERMLDVIFIGIITGIVGARLYFIVFSDGVYDTFAKLIDLRGGGLAIYGGIIGGFLGAVIGCRVRKVALLPMCDVVSMGFLIGQALGRWGNFFNQEAFGANTNLPWGMISPETTAYLRANEAKLTAEGMFVDPFLPVHPTFLYESLWNALGFLLLFWYRKRRRFNGEILLLYIIWYGVGRFFIEGLRTDSLMVSSLGLRVSQILAALSALAALAVWVVARTKTAGKPLAVPVLPEKEGKVRVQTPEGVQTVTIRWPGNDPAPSRAEKQAMARAALAQETPPEDAQTPKESPGDGPDSPEE